MVDFYGINVGKSYQSPWMVWVIWNLHELGPGNSVGTFHDFFGTFETARKESLTIICFRGGGCNFCWNLFLGIGNFGNWRTKLKHFRLLLTGWWFQPIWKILVKMGIFPKVRGENKTYLKPPPSWLLILGREMWFVFWMIMAPCRDLAPPLQKWPAFSSSSMHWLVFFRGPCLHLTEDLLEHILQQDAYIWVPICVPRCVCGLMFKRGCFNNKYRIKFGSHNKCF